MQNKFEIKLKSLKNAKIELIFTKKFSLKSKLPNLGQIKIENSCKSKLNYQTKSKFKLKCEIDAKSLN